MHLRWDAEVEPLQPPQPPVSFKLRVAPPAAAREMASAGALMNRGPPSKQPANRRRGRSPNPSDRWIPGPSAPPVLEPLPAAASQRGGASPYIVGTEGPCNGYTRSRSPPMHTGQYTGHVGYTSRDTSRRRSRKSETACVHWSNFRCFKGDNCPFLHAGPGSNKEAPRGYFDRSPPPRR